MFICTQDTASLYLYHRFITNLRRHRWIDTDFLILQVIIFLEFSKEEFKDTGRVCISRTAAYNLLYNPFKRFRQHLHYQNTCLSVTRFVVLTIGSYNLSLERQFAKLLERTGKSRNNKVTIIAAFVVLIVFCLSPVTLLHAWKIY